MASVGTVVVELDANTAKLVEGVKRSQKQLSSLQKTVNSTKKSVKDIAKYAVGFYALSKSIGAVSNAFKSFVNTSAQFEQFETTLRSITGSSEEARTSMKWITDFTSKTPYQLAQVTEGFVKMKAYGLDPMDGTLKTLGNTASAMGKDIVQAVEAMADAVTGENERLKEFGIKASKSGDTIAYAWSDSSGKARNIVIENNKDIIQSTLNAIFNEKYAGAMDAQSRTWNGMVSNMADKWTLFQRDVMEEGGLFNYLKASGVVLSNLMDQLFDKGKGAAKGFAESIMSSIKSIITGGGVLSDTFTGFGVVIGFLKTAFWQLVGVIGTGINTIQEGWTKLGNAMSSVWATLANGVKDIFATMINWIIDKINSLSGVINSAAKKLGFDTVFGELTRVSFDKTKADIQELGKPISNVATAWEYARQAQKEYEKDAADFAKGTGQQKAKEMIQQIQKEYEKLSVSEKVSNAEKEKAKQLLDEIIEKYGKVGQAQSKAAAKAAKDAKKAADKAKKEADKKAKEAAMQFTDQFRGMLESLFSGDIAGAFKGFFDGMTTQLIQPFVTKMSDKLSSSLNNLIGGGDLFGVSGLGSALLGGAISLVGSLFGSDDVAPPVLEDIAKTSDSMANSLSLIESVQYPMLTLTRDMKGYLGVIANSFGAIENSLLRSNIDFSGAFYKPTTKSGALGFSSKDYSLFGTTLDFEAATIAEIMAEDLRVVSNTIIKKVYDSFWKTKTTYFDNYKNVSSLFAEDIADATTALFSGFTAIGNAIGISMDGLLNEVIDIGLINTTGKSDAAIAAEIEARFSAQTDAIAEQYLSVVAEFQRAGEGLAETAFRVALTFDQVSHSMELIGKTVNWRTANIIEIAAGGLDNLSLGLNTYMDNFFTDSEQYAMKLNTMTKSFASLGLALPASNLEFRALVDSIDTTTDAGASLFAEVISLADGFVDLRGSMVSVKDMVKEVADAWLGNLSYLNQQQKAEYSSGYLAIASQSGGAIDTVEAARLAAETALKTTATREEYIPIFERYVSELENQAPEATTDDVVARLDELIARVVDLEETTRKVG